MKPVFFTLGISELLLETKDKRAAFWTLGISETLHKWDRFSWPLEIPL